MKRRHIKLLVAMPVGPNETLEHLHDTIESVIRYTGPSRRIVLVNNGGSKGIAKKVVNYFDNILVIQNEFGVGLYSTLYYGITNAIKKVLSEYTFDVCLKMDVDALMIGDNPEDDACKFFKKNPDVGAIGSYIVDCNGVLRNNSYHAKPIIKDAKRSEYMHNVLEKAVSYGYKPGENCQGGAYFISGACIQKMNDEGCFDFKDMPKSKVYEEVLFNLFMNSTGYKNADFATDPLPFGIRWLGLPDSPQELIRRKKRIIHSVKFYQSLKQDEIRFYFSKQRDLKRVK
jgi:hypothetical protein